MDFGRDDPCERDSGADAFDTFSRAQSPITALPDARLALYGRNIYHGYGVPFRPGTRERAMRGRERKRERDPTLGMGAGSNKFYCCFRNRDSGTFSVPAEDRMAFKNLRLSIAKKQRASRQQST